MAMIPASRRQGSAPRTPSRISQATRMTPIVLVTVSASSATSTAPISPKETERADQARHAHEAHHVHDEQKARLRIHLSTASTAITAGSMVRTHTTKIGTLATYWQ